MAASSKAVVAASSSLTTHIRPFTCSASASASSSYPSRLVQHPPDLIKWVKSEGGFVHEAVKISHDNNNLGGLGLVAAQDIPKGSNLIGLPPHLPLSFYFDNDIHTGNAGSVLANLARKVPGELWAMKLGLRLLQERAKVGSFWWPYISNLPEAYSVPIFFPGEDIKNLQYAPFLYQVNKRCRFLLEFEQEVKKTLDNLKPSDHPFGSQVVNASALGWAMSAVSSRAFRLHGRKLPDGTQHDIPMMLPLIDMCNHSFNPNSQIVQEQGVRSSEAMLVKVVAQTAIRQNDPLMLNYGCLNNDLFLLDYGFIVPSNPYDCVELKYDGALLDAASMAAGVSSPKFSSPAPWQQQFLSRLNLHGHTPLLKVTLGGPDLVEGRFLAALRALLTDDVDTVLEHDLDTLKSLSAKAPLGVANEIAVFRTVIALCVIALEHFPTKIIEDEPLLKRDVSESTTLAVKFRIEKKFLIINLMKDLSRRVKLLQSIETT